MYYQYIVFHKVTHSVIRILYIPTAKVLNSVKGWPIELLAKGDSGV